MSPTKGRRMWDFLVEHELHDCLELGFFHGVSSLYIAAALERLGSGHLLTFDRLSARRLEPNIDVLLSQAGLAHRVTAHYEPVSYTRGLLRLLEQQPDRRFDFCYIDGEHNWDDAGYSFFLTSQLLRPGGWIIFDDLDWTYATSAGMRHTTRVQAMPEEERSMPHVRKVFELLVRPHVDFDTVFEADGWGYARKAEG